MSEMHAVGRIPEWTKADRLGKALDHAGIKTQDMAEFLGVHRNTVGNYINGRTEADKRTVMLWAQRTGVPVEWIEGTGGSPNRGPGITTAPKDPDAAIADLAARRRGRRGSEVTGRYLAPGRLAA
jgi:transcriptional regulator with XRE-family HTH domain